MKNNEVEKEIKEEINWNDTTENYIMNTITYDIGKLIEEHSEYYQILKKDYEESSGNVVDMIGYLIFHQSDYIERHWRRISRI